MIISEILQNSLKFFVDIFTKCYKNIQGNLLDAYEIHSFFFNSENNQNCISAFNSMKSLILANGTQFSENNNSLTFDTIKNLFDISIPKELLIEEEKLDLLNSKTEKIQINEETCIRKCKLHIYVLELIYYVYGRFYFTYTLSLRDKYLFLIYSSYEFFSNFNNNIKYRFNIWKYGLLKSMEDIPSLHKYHRYSLTIYLNILFDMMNYYSKKEIDEYKNIKKKFFNVISTVISEYVKQQKDYHLNQQNIKIMQEKKETIDPLILTVNKELGIILSNIGPVISENIIEKILTNSLLQVFINSMKKNLLKSLK